MRKITQQAVAAFLEGRAFTSKNTDVVLDTDNNVVSLVLHGNVIAVRDIESPLVHVTTAGWDTTTTKERLNGIPGVSVYHNRGQLFLNSEKWDGESARVTLLPL